MFFDAQKAHRLQKSVRFFFWNAQIIIASAAGEWYNKSAKNIDVSRLSACLLESFKLPLCRCCGTSRGGSDHVEQVTAAEQLYGRQLTFRISHEELRSELNLLSEAYSPDILQRAERVLLEQKRKHSWLF